MVRHAVHNLVLALTLLALTVPAGRAFAQSTTTSPTGVLASHMPFFSFADRAQS